MPRGLHPNSRKNLEKRKPFESSDDSALKAAKKSQEKQREDRKNKALLGEFLSCFLEINVKKTSDFWKKAKTIGKMFGMNPEEVNYKTAIIAAQITKAINGDTRAAEFIADRTDGKPKQAIEVQEHKEQDWEPDEELKRRWKEVYDLRIEMRVNKRLAEIKEKEEAETGIDTNE